MSQQMVALYLLVRGRGAYEPGVPEDSLNHKQKFRVTVLPSPFLGSQPGTYCQLPATDCS